MSWWQLDKTPYKLLILEPCTGVDLIKSMDGKQTERVILFQWQTSIWVSALDPSGSPLGHDLYCKTLHVSPDLVFLDNLFFAQQRFEKIHVVVSEEKDRKVYADMYLQWILTCNNFISVESGSSLIWHFC